MVSVRTRVRTDVLRVYLISPYQLPSAVRRRRRRWLADAGEVRHSADILDVVVADEFQTVKWLVGSMTENEGGGVTDRFRIPPCRRRRTVAACDRPIADASGENIRADGAIVMAAAVT